MLTIFNKAKKPRFLKVSLVMFDQCSVITSEKIKEFLLSILLPLLIAQFPSGPKYNSIPGYF